MSKRIAAGSRPSRKRRKAGASYASIDIDGTDGFSGKVEDVRVWSVTTSEATGRVSATRKTHRHVYESPPEPLREEPSTVEESIITPVYPEPGELPLAKSVAKRRRVRIVKENDSVSLTNPSNQPNTHVPIDKDGRLAFLPSGRVGRGSSQGWLGRLEQPGALCKL